MAFRQLPKAAFGGKAATNPTVAIYKNNTVFSVPASLLARAGLSSKSGEKITILVGEGDDAGAIAVTNGADFTLISNNGSHVTLRFNSGRLGRSPSYKARPLAFEIQDGAVILNMPSDFPWKDAVKPQAPAAPARRVITAIGAAA